MTSYWVVGPAFWGPAVRLDEWRHAVGKVQQRPAIDLGTDRGIGDGMPTGDLAVPPNPLQGIGVTEARRAVRGHELPNRLARMNNRLDGVHPSPGPRHIVGKHTLVRGFADLSCGPINEEFGRIEKGRRLGHGQLDGGRVRLSVAERVGNAARGRLLDHEIQDGASQAQVRSGQNDGVRADNPVRGT